MIYEYWFAKIKGLSVKKKQALREYFGDGKAIYNIEEKGNFVPDYINEKERFQISLAKKETNLEESYRKMESEGIRFVPYFLNDYPEKLSQISGGPYALYVKGRLPEKERLSAAIVGARQCSPYGEKIALEYGRELAKCGIQIISGMAKGIDGAGQRGALNAKGNTYSVLGCGVDICYPKEHYGLYRDIQEQGGIISEYAMGMPPLSSHFPARNRIISGLSDIILVIEAKEKSGSLITADMALEQGKDVYALPGPVTSALSYGCHFLISQGAGILLSPEELLKQLNISCEKLNGNSDKNKKELETPKNIVYSCLDLYPKGIQTIVEETKLESKKVMTDLVSLELEGKVKEISKNYYVRT